MIPNRTFYTKKINKKVHSAWSLFIISIIDYVKFKYKTLQRGGGLKEAVR